MAALVRVAASPLVRASFRSLRRSSGCARPRGAPAQTRCVRAASSARGAAETRDENASAADPASDISKRDLLHTSAAVRLSSYVYKQGDVEPWVTRDGFVLRAQGNTECTRWFVCDELEDADDEHDRPGRLAASPSDANGGSRRVLTRRWFIVRGAAWNDDDVDSVRLSTQIARAWPAPLHAGVPVVCHAGVAEMTEQFWPEMEPWIEDAARNHPRASMSFTGHSLGGSMATLLMAWALHRCGVDPARLEPARTFGSPPVLAADRWAIRRDALVAGADARAERVARELARGGDWVGELAAAVGWGGVGEKSDAERTANGTVGGGGRGGPNRDDDASSGVRRPSSVSAAADATASATAFATASTVRSMPDPTPEDDRTCALRLAGFAPDAVRAFVLSNDPVPRMWLAADPFFGAATANETVLSALAAREAMFGAGVFSTERFLYEAVGTLYWLRWSPAGTELAVHAHDDAFVEEPASFETDADADADADAGGERRDGDAPPRAAGRGGNARRLKMAPPWEGDLAQSLRAAFDHNAGNYVDAVQWLALKKLNLSKSANL